MDPSPSTVTVWHRGRLVALAPVPRDHRREREAMAGAALLAACAVVMAFYVAVLRRDVEHGQALHQAQRTGVQALQCAPDPAALRRGECLPVGPQAVAAAAP